MYYLIPIFYYIFGMCFFLIYDLYYNLNNDKILNYNSIDFNDDLTNKLLNEDDNKFNIDLNVNV
jgi:hypothetical protein